jgi:phosphatidylinositol alpha-1,6-mannosyltransferase
VGDSNACDPSCNREPETVLHVAQLNEAYKGTDVLMRAIPLLEGSVPNLKLVIVGDGKLRAQHELHARRLGVADRVHFLGRVSDEERDYWLRTASAFAMPSRLPADGGGEGFGIVFLEATAAGLPVVAGNVGGARDAVADGQTGVLVDPDSVEEVARGIRRCLVDTSLRRRVAESRYSWLRRFSWETITPRIEIAVGEAVLGGRRSELRFVRAGRLPR